MVKPRRSQQQQSKKKLQVKQRKQSKAEKGAEKSKESSISSVSPDNASKETTAAKTEAPGESSVTVYGLNNLGNTCFYNSALQVCGCPIHPMPMALHL